MFWHQCWWHCLSLFSDFFFALNIFVDIQPGLMIAHVAYLTHGERRGNLASIIWTHFTDKYARNIFQVCARFETLLHALAVQTLDTPLHALAVLIKDTPLHALAVQTLDTPLHALALYVYTLYSECIPTCYDFSFYWDTGRSTCFPVHDW